VALTSLLPLPTGLLVLHWEANGSSSWGFNASVGSARCGSGGPGSCPVPQECVPQDGAAGAGLCRCPQGWAGPHCRMALCPENCNAHTGSGICNQVQMGKGQTGGIGVVIRAPLSLLSAVPRAWVYASVLRASGVRTVPRSWMVGSWSGRLSWTAACQP
jgi:hypothetical protein